MSTDLPHILPSEPERPYTAETQAEWLAVSDTRLVRSCLAGKEAAWAALIDRYSRLIYTIPLRFGFSQMVADEIFQETCLILLEGLETLQDSERIRSWLVTVTRRLCIQRIRQWRKTEIGEFSDADVVADTAVETDLVRLEQQHLVQQALTRLPARDQQLLWALFFEDPPWSYNEIAAHLQIPEGSIGPLRARSLDKLRRELLRLERTASSWSTNTD